MYSASRSLGSLFLVLTIGILLVSGCENPGSVGADLTDDRADIVIDTFRVDGITTSQYNWYSGDYAYFSAGQFNDPLFGNLRAIGMVKPSLPIAADTLFGPNSIMKMRIILNDDLIYGDPSAPQQFDVYLIDETWRGRAWLLNEEVEYLTDQLVASFSIEDQDSIDVVLDTSWVNIYRDYAQDTTAAADSAYRYEVGGLALVPTNTSKVIPLNSQQTRFVIESPEDTLEIPLAEWAYSLNRGTPNIPANSMALHSTLENVLTFELDLSNVDIQGIAKAELVLYQNESVMESSIAASAERPDAPTAELYIVEPEVTPEGITIGRPVVTGDFSEADNAYHFTITSIVQRIVLDGIREEERFYITLPNNGTIRSSLIYGSQATDENAPKLIITSLKNNDS